MVSIMEKEALEAPARIKEQLSVNKNPIQEIVQKIKEFNPHYVMTVGRGTSDHAGVQMPVKNTHARIIPVVLLQRFYLDVEKIAQSRGVNPDAPPRLKKVTKTL